VWQRAKDSNQQRFLIAAKSTTTLQYIGKPGELSYCALAESAAQAGLTAGGSQETLTDLIENGLYQESVDQQMDTLEHWHAHNYWCRLEKAIAAGGEITIGEMPEADMRCRNAARVVDPDRTNRLEAQLGWNTTILNCHAACMTALGMAFGGRFAREVLAQGRNQGVFSQVSQALVTVIGGSVGGLGMFILARKQRRLAGRFYTSLRGYLN
jgi:hypothetical protein